MKEYRVCLMEVLHDYKDDLGSLGLEDSQMLKELEFDMKRDQEEGSKGRESEMVTYYRIINYIIFWLDSDRELRISREEREGG
jgi:hypothetical protein